MANTTYIASVFLLKNKCLEIMTITMYYYMLVWFHSKFRSMDTCKLEFLFVAMCLKIPLGSSNSVRMEVHRAPYADDICL